MTPAGNEPGVCASIHLALAARVNNLAASSRVVGSGQQDGERDGGKWRLVAENP